MIIYRGDDTPLWEPNRFQRSRYGFVVLFFATEIRLAELYAVHRSKRSNFYSGGCVWKAEIDKVDHTVDFGGEHSYQFKFQKKIMELKSMKIKSARIANVVDYPSVSLAERTHSDVVVVFDLSILKNWELIKRNVRK